MPETYFFNAVSGMGRLTVKNDTVLLVGRNYMSFRNNTLPGY